MMKFRRRSAFFQNAFYSVWGLGEISLVRGLNTHLSLYCFIVALTNHKHILQGIKVLPVLKQK